MAGLALLAGPTWASDTPDPSAVTFAGSFQEELGCPGDWQPECAVPRLDFDAEDGIWQGTFDFPAGSWEYKAALNGAWDENYGANATRNGSNLSLNLAAAAPVKLYYDHETHWATSNRSATIVTAAGSFQSELGCPGDWQPDCLRSWLQDPDGDGIYTFRTRSLPAGNYEVKAAVDEGWAENYGAGGVSNGPNIAFSVSASCAETVFSFDDSTKVLTVSAGGPPEQPDFVTIPGSFQQELGCPGDWQPDCADTHLTYDDADGIWQGTFDVPAGSWEYKAAIDNAWDENYGANATRGGGNLSLNLSEAAAVKFYYDHGTHWVTSNRNAVIATAAGSFQSELGCPGDWQPDCLRSWLQDPDGDGLYTFTTRSIQAGSYEVKVAINESWSENYGAGGARDGANIGFTVPSDCTEVFFQYDAVSHILTVSAQGAPRGNISRAQAHWVLEDTFAWNVGAVPAGAVATLHYAPDGGLTLESTGIVAGGGGSSITLVQDPAGLPQEVKDKFPHLAGYAAFKIPAASLGLVPQILQGQIAISLAAADGTLIDATGLQIPGVLDDLYTYEGELGVVWDGPVPTLRVWAPTARSVKVLVYDSSRAAAPSGTFAMSRNAQGVWSYTGDANWLGKYYVYEVEVFVRTTGQVETNRVTDPYSLSLSRNSQRTQIVRLDDASLKPAGWDALVKPRLDAFEDITLYELHVRDFSASAPTVPEALQGTFKAFALPGANGMRHLAALARAGLTHVHLLPAFDIATIDEDKNQWRQPEGDLAAFPPDSEEQQARVEAVADLDPFNWGYDPWHFTVPEGSYSTNPDGGTRVAEFREMVQGLSNAGLRVVMDVVYNHTNAAGQNDKSVFDRIVPGYYHRLNADGNVETSTCCQNTASEHNMMEKLLIDSVVTWARDYKVDGFRFDLMGHHMKRNMIKLRQALDALTLEEDGVDGARVYLYGEGWNFGEVANNARGVNATQLNMAGTGIGTFSDRLRDGVRGGGPFSGLQEQGFLTGLFYDPNATDQGSGEDQKNRLLLYSDWIRVGLAGNLADYELIDRNGNLVRGREIDYNGQPAGYTADPQEVITYIEAHDNETLFDAIQMKAPVATSMADRVRMQNLGMSIVGFGQGIPFFHAGVELLRSKSLDRNSYNSGDWFNKLDFTYQDNNWGVGLPPARDNQSNWPILQPLLANPALEAAPGDIADALAHFEEVLAIRRSSPLFRLRTAAQVEEHLSFHNTGPGQVPGVIVMDLADAEGEVDRQHTRIVVVINATDETQGLTVPALQGVSLRLHPIQAGSNDPVVRTAAVSSLGTFTVPARTGAVFWAERPRVDQIDLLIADVEALAPVIGGGRANALAAKLRAARRQVARGNETPAINQIEAFLIQLHVFANRGFVPRADADRLAAEANAILAVLRQ